MSSNIAKITNHQTAPSNTLRHEVIPFTVQEVAVFDACLSIEKAAWEVDNKRAAVAEAVRAMFGDTAPTFSQYRALQEAVLLQCIEAGYTGQAMRKHVAAAVKAAYGTLPVSDSPAAVAKRAQRPAKAPKAPKAEKPASDNVSDDDGSEVAQPSDDAIESYIARVGVAAALAAIGRILDVEDATKPEAAVVFHVMQQLAA